MTSVATGDVTRTGVLSFEEEEEGLVVGLILRDWTRLGGDWRLAMMFLASLRGEVSS